LLHRAELFPDSPMTVGGMHRQVLVPRRWEAHADGHPEWREGHRPPPHGDGEFWPEEPTSTTPRTADEGRKPPPHGDGVFGPEETMTKTLCTADLSEEA
jgi:hypothetical protein